MSLPILNEKEEGILMDYLQFLEQKDIMQKKDMQQFQIKCTVSRILKKLKTDKREGMIKMALTKGIKYINSKGAEVLIKGKIIYSENRREINPIDL